MVSTVVELFDSWTAAEAPTVDVHRAPWPQLERLRTVVAPLREHVEASSLAADVVTGAYLARRMLTATPLAPTHPLIGLGELAEAIAAFTAERPGHSLTPLLAPVAAAVADLLTGPSPVAQACADVLCEYGETPVGTPEALLVVPRRAWVEPVRRWLAAEELTCVDVATPADLRSTPAGHVAVVVLGHPALAFSSAFRAPEVAAREYGWLLTAPPAGRVRLVLTADAPRVQGEALWLLPRGAHPPLRLTDAGPTRTLTGPVLEPGVAMEPVPHEWVAAPPAALRRTPAPLVAPEEGSTAVEVHLASGHAVFFHPEIGARPHQVVVDDDTGAVALTTTKVAELRRGAVLAVRVGAAAYEQVLGRADAWLRTRRGWTRERIEEVRMCSLRLKLELLHHLALRGHEPLRRQLSRYVSDSYARVLLHNPLTPNYIAPQKREGFDALVKVLGVNDIAGRYTELATVRAAHQQAGEAIRRELLDTLRTQPWVADVDDQGWAAISAGDLGDLLLAVVTARLDHPVTVPRTWLGAPIDNRGRRVSALPLSKEEA